MPDCEHQRTEFLMRRDGVDYLRCLDCDQVFEAEDLVEIALTECERFYPAFQFVIWGGKRAAEAVAASMIEVAGQA